MKLREGVIYVTREGITVRVLPRPGGGFAADNGLTYNEDGLVRGERPLRNMPEDIVLEVKARPRT